MEDDEQQSGIWVPWLFLLGGLAFAVLGYFAGRWLRIGRSEAFFVGLTWFVAIGTSVVGGRTQRRWREEGWSPATLGGVVVTGILSVITFTLIAIAVLWMSGRS